MTPLAGWQSSPTHPTTPAPFDVHLVGKNNVEVAQAVVAKLKDAYTMGAPMKTWQFPWKT